VQIVNQFVELLLGDVQLEDAILNPFPIALKEFTEAIPPSVIGDIIGNNHPLVHIPALIFTPTSGPA
jgi:hypothetical protein